MKNFILLVLTSLLLTSCAHFSDGTSVWSDWVWVIPTLTGGGCLWFLYVAYRKSKSGSEQEDRTVQPGQTGGYKQFKENVPIYKIGQFYFSVILFLATIGIIIGVNLSK